MVIITGFIILFCFQTNGGLNINAHTKLSNIIFYESENGIRVIKTMDYEFYFNRSNGGEITEYFDLVLDPTRERNLVNIHWKPYHNILPLFTSIFYKNPNPNPSIKDRHEREIYSNAKDSIYSTGGDRNANLWVLSYTNEYLIIQSTSKIMSRSGQALPNVLVNSTWIFHKNGLISVERTFFTPNDIMILKGWKWYPFYFTRKAGFSGNATYYMFNTTYSFTPVVKLDYFPLFPQDTRYNFGIAVPFSNETLGGDGTHNFLMAYKYDELVDVNEWRSDNYHSIENDVTECGAVTNKFPEDIIFPTHTYHMIIKLTHKPVTESIVSAFADYYADDTSIALLMQTSVTSEKDTYYPGDSYVFRGSGISYYNLPNITGRFTITKHSNDQITFEKKFGPKDIFEGQTFNNVLLEGFIGLDAPVETYTALLEIYSPFKITISTSEKIIEVIHK